MIGGAIIGRVIDKLGLKQALVLSLIVTTLSFCLMLYYLHLYTFSWITFLVTFMWGVQDSTINNIMNCTLGFDFDSKDPATPFAVQNFMQPLFVFVFMIL
jgi:MFS family permease